MFFRQQDHGKKHHRPHHNKSEKGHGRHHDDASEAGLPIRQDPRTPRDSGRETTPKASLIDVREYGSGSEHDDHNYKIESGRKSHREIARKGGGSVRSDSQARLNVPAKQSRHALEPDRPPPVAQLSRGQLDRPTLTFRPRLSHVAQQYVELGIGQYKECIAFINENPAVLDEPIDNFWNDSKNAIRHGEDNHAQRCCQQAVILRGYDKESHEKAIFIKGILRPDDDAQRVLRDFLSKVEQVFQRMSEEAGFKRGETQSPPSSHSARLSATRHSSALVQNDLPPTSGHGRAVTYQQELTKSVMHRHGTGGPTQASGQVTTSGAATGPRHGAHRPSSADYTVCDSSFFEIGRVFSVRWYEGQGTKSLTNSSQTGVQGQTAYGTYRRMVVVKAQHGCSWCLPIYTYQYRGLSKRGFNKRDIDMHAIVHTSDVTPAYLKGEPHSTKRPIAIDAADFSQKLHPTSRINFSKIHTVEHNSPIMFVGTVHKESLHWLITYWKNACEI